MARLLDLVKNLPLGQLQLTPTRLARQCGRSEEHANHFLKPAKQQPAGGGFPFGTSTVPRYDGNPFHWISLSATVDPGSVTHPSQLVQLSAIQSKMQMQQNELMPSAFLCPRFKVFTLQLVQDFASSF